MAIIEKIRPFAPFILLAALVIAAYSNSLSGKFLLDDDLLIKDNDYIKSWSHFPKLFTEDMGGNSGYVYRFYRPVQLVVDMIGYSIWKLDVRGYHVTSIFFHIAVVFALYGLIITLFKDSILALFTAMLYGVHPINSESVAAISVIGDPIVAFFILISLALYVKHSESPGVPAYFLVYPAYLMALFTKESAIMFLAIILLYHAAFRVKVRIPQIIGLAAVAGSYLVFRGLFFKGTKMGLPPDMSPAGIISRMPGVFVAVSGYIRELLWPFGLHMGHEHRLFSMANAAAIAGLAMVIAAVLLFAFAVRRRNALVCFAIGWFFIWLAPTSNLYPISFYMSDHYMYLPSIGFFLIIGWLLRLAYGTKALKALALAAVVILTGFYTVRTAQQNMYWKDAVTFYERTLRFTPQSTRSLNNLAGRYLLAGDLQKAEGLYKRVLDVDPNFALAYYNLAIICYKEGKYDEAAKRCAAALALDPRYAPAYNELGLIYWAAGKRDEAVAAYERSIAVSPDNPVAMRNLAIAYSSLGRKEKAAGLLKEAARVRPDYIEAYYDLSGVYIDMGRTEEAVSAITRALEVSPKMAALYNRLGFIYFVMGKDPEAADAYRKAIAIRPDNVTAMNDLAILYYKGGKREEAFGLLKKAIAIAPDYPAAYTNLGRMYLETGKSREAEEVLKKALELDPENKQVKEMLSGVGK